MDLSLLAKLKEELIHAEQFSDVWAYFLDHFGEDPAFLALGTRTRHEMIESLLIQTAQKICQMQVAAVDIILTRIAEHHFIHGGYCAGGRMINVLYFEDALLGTIMVCSLGS